jgi:hypothetical protein
MTPAQQLVASLLEGFKEKKAQFIEAGADPALVDQAITAYKQLKARRMLSPEEADIDKIESFEALQALVDEAGKRERSPTAKTRTLAKHPESTVVHEDDKVMVVVPNSKEAAQFYGKGTKWCISAEGANHFHTYRRDLAKHFMFLFKNKSSSDPWYKTALTVYPDGRRLVNDATDAGRSLEEFQQATGFDPKKFPAWDWREMPPQEQWKVAKRSNVRFVDFVKTTSPENWDALGQRVTNLKRQWIEAQKSERPDVDEAQLEKDWVEFWRVAKTDALGDTNDSDYLDTLQYYVEIVESLRAGDWLARLLLDGVIQPGEAKAFIMSVTPLDFVRQQLTRVSKGPYYKGAQEPVHIAGGDEPDPAAPPA